MLFIRFIKCCSNCFLVCSTLIKWIWKSWFRLLILIVVLATIIIVLNFCSIRWSVLSDKVSLLSFLSSFHKFQNSVSIGIRSWTIMLVTIFMVAIVVIARIVIMTSWIVNFVHWWSFVARDIYLNNSSIVNIVVHLVFGLLKTVHGGKLLFYSRLLFVYLTVNTESQSKLIWFTDCSHNNSCCSIVVHFSSNNIV